MLVVVLVLLMLLLLVMVMFAVPPRPPSRLELPKPPLVAGPSGLVLRLVLANPSRARNHREQSAADEQDKGRKVSSRFHSVSSFFSAATVIA